MLKRTASALAWFAAVWVAYEIIWSLSGVPRIIGPIAALAVAALIALDPAALLWARSARTDEPNPAAIGRVTAGS